jgi:acyl dehydratase
MIVLAERTFTPADQERFAALSGDFNPMHMDPIAARRTVFGAPVVHGVHLLLWALDSWVRGRTIALERVKASFNRGVLVGDLVRVCLVKDGEDFALQIQRNESKLVPIRGKLGVAAEYAGTFPSMGAMKCREMNPAEAASAAGMVPLTYSPADASALFPHLSSALPAVQLAELLATTRLVGMECPGLHSLYSGLDLSFSGPATGEAVLNYRVTRADDFGRLSLAVEGPGFQGELRAFLRPPPSSQKSARELAGLVTRGAFAGQKAVVVGGSRGLGEVTAKLLAMGGADVTITYHRGKSDAEAVGTEINSAGGTCKVAQFDCTQPGDDELFQSLTHLYYFATPHISSDDTVLFSPERFSEYCRYYVTGFAQTLMAAQGAAKLQVFYPSTIFLDDAPAHMSEYCAAKAAGEELCKQLAKPGWRIHAPRLPRMHTDQNNGFLPPEMEAVETVMLRYLLESASES